MQEVRGSDPGPRAWDAKVGSIYMSIYRSICVYIYISLSLSIYIYICMCIYIYIYTHIMSASQPAPRSWLRCAARRAGHSPGLACSFIFCLFFFISKHILYFQYKYFFLNFLLNFLHLYLTSFSTPGGFSCPRVLPVSVKKTLLLGEPLPCTPAAETALQSLIRHSESLRSH